MLPIRVKGQGLHQPLTALSLVGLIQLLAGLPLEGLPPLNSVARHGIAHRTHAAGVETLAVRRELEREHPAQEMVALDDAPTGQVVGLPLRDNAAGLQVPHRHLAHEVASGHPAAVRAESHCLHRRQEVPGVLQRAARRVEHADGGLGAGCRVVLIATGPVLTGDTGHPSPVWRSRQIPRPELMGLNRSKFFAGGQIQPVQNAVITRRHQLLGTRQQGHATGVTVMATDGECLARLDRHPLNRAIQTSGKQGLPVWSGFESQDRRREFDFLRLGQLGLCGRSR